jgi:GMP synthase (glutamine-hydrolysing)
MHDNILIVDFGSQVTQLIARRVREHGVYSEIVPFQKAAAAFAAMKPRAIILSGGPASVLDPDAPLPPPEFYGAGVPILGICYGEQAMAHQLGGKVEGGHHREFGRAEVEITRESALLSGVWKRGEKYPVWMSHGDWVTELPEGFRVVATPPNALIADADEVRRFYATQFHSWSHTPWRRAAGNCRDMQAAPRLTGRAPSRTRRSRKIRKQVGRAGQTRPLRRRRSWRWRRC